MRGPRRGLPGERRAVAEGRCLRPPGPGRARSPRLGGSRCLLQQPAFPRRRSRCCDNSRRGRGELCPLEPPQVASKDRQVVGRRESWGGG